MEYLLHPYKNPIFAVDMNDVQKKLEELAFLKQEREREASEAYRLLMEQLAEIRRHQGISYTRMACETQIDRSYLNMMERGKVNASVTKLLNFAQALGYRLVLEPMDNNQADGSGQGTPPQEEGV